MRSPRCLCVRPRLTFEPINRLLFAVKVMPLEVDPLRVAA
jgi:hypothetical protein